MKKDGEELGYEDWYLVLEMLVILVSDIPKLGLQTHATDTDYSISPWIQDQIPLSDCFFHWQKHIFSYLQILHL